MIEGGPMFCESCGATLGDSARFCSACGKPVRREGEPQSDPLREALQRALPPNLSIVRPLGRGGMGTVYLARDEFLDREVAIKTLPAELGSDSALRDRFRREARIAAKLHHPNIVPLHTFGEAENILYYVMGYVRGETLAQRLTREGTLEVESARRILAEVADALRYANAQSVIHRDLKPENILIDDSDGTAFLADFGIARIAGATSYTRAGAVIGTPLYMSPEQAIGAEVDHRSDLYSLGVIGYRMLTGRFPLSGETFSEMLAQQAARKPDPVTSANPAVPAEIDEAISRCLEKDPADRWQSAADLRTALAGTTGDEWEGEAPQAQSAGFYFLLFLWIAALLSPFEIFVWKQVDPGWRVLVQLLQTLPLFGLLASVVGLANARKENIPWPRLWRSIFHPPRWYWGWMPRRLRPRGDVWERLPRVVRVNRVLVTFGVLLAPLLIVSIPLLTLSSAGHTFGLVAVSLAYAAMLPAAVTTATAMRYLKKIGVQRDADTSALLFRASWLLGRSRNPLIAKVLFTPAPRSTPARGDDHQATTAPASTVGPTDATIERT